MGVKSWNHHFHLPVQSKSKVKRTWICIELSIVAIMPLMLYSFPYFVPLVLSQTPANTPYDTTEWTRTSSVSCGVHVYSPAFPVIHCAHPRRDGQAEYTRVVLHRYGLRPALALNRVLVLAGFLLGNTLRKWCCAAYFFTCSKLFIFSGKCHSCNNTFTDVHNILL